MTYTLPKVSIGMPVFNGAQYIREALDSLLAQTFTDFELIISDNASTDDTQAICKEYALLDRRIHYVRQKYNMGASANFKFVLECAQADFFMWAASDDRWKPGFVRVCADVLEENADCVSVFTNYQVIDLVSGDTIAISSPTPSASCHRFDRVFGRIFEMSPTMIYGLHRTPQLKSVGVENFDLYDVFVTIAMSELGKMLVVPSAKFIAGSKNHGIPYSLTGRRIDLRQFQKRVIVNVEKNFSRFDSFVLTMYLRFVVLRAKIAFFRRRV